jgi:hypothetical protein
MIVLNVKRVERFGWFLVAILLAYWAVYVAVAPVTTSDSHIYNLARLLIAERGGLFYNNLWTNTPQVVFPWGFDSVYYPFLKIGRFENLPAFLCLIGSFLCVVVLFRREGLGEAIPFALLVLLSSPLIVFQATCAKNDIAVAFFALAAFTLIELSRDGRNMVRDSGIAISLGMLAGAKTSGIIPAVILGAYALGIRWSDEGLRGVWRTGCLIALAMVLLGSSETYLNNYMMFGRPMGDQGFIQGHQNPDGLRGAAANLVRYFFNSLATGLEGATIVREYRVYLWGISDGFLRLLSLEGRGMAPFFPEKKFLLGCHECASTYGIAGLVAIPLVGLAIFRNGVSTAAGRLALLGLFLFAAACMTIGWQMFIMRLILAPALILMIAAIMQASHFLLNRKRTLLPLQLGFFLLAILVPLCSWNRGPKYVLAAIKNRQTEWLQEGKIRADIEGRNAVISLSQKIPAGRAVILGPDDGALLYLNDNRNPWEILPNPEAKKILDDDFLEKSLGNKSSVPWIILTAGHNWDIILPKEAKLIWEKEQHAKAYLFQSASSTVICK